MTATTSLRGFWEAWPLFQDAVLTGTIAGMLLGVLGVFIVLGRMVFVSAALSQTASLGVTIAYFLQTLGLAGFFVSPSLGASLLSLVALALVWSGDEESKSRRDSMLGVLFLVGASGTVMLASRMAQELHDVKTLLFGTSVAVLPADFWTILCLSVLILSLYLCCWRGFVEITYDEASARVRGLPVNLLKVTLMVTIALAVSICTRVLGALPSFAFGVFPALAGIALAPNVPRAMVLAAVIGALSGFLGYLAAFLYDLPVGASQAMAGAGFWLLSLLIIEVIPQGRPLKTV